MNMFDVQFLSPSAIFCQPDTWLNKLKRESKFKKLRYSWPHFFVIKKIFSSRYIRSTPCLVFFIRVIQKKMFYWPRSYDWVGLVPSPLYLQMKKTNGPLLSTRTIPDHMVNYKEPASNWLQRINSEGLGKGWRRTALREHTKSSHSSHPCTSAPAWGLFRKWTKALSPVGQTLDQVLPADWSLALEDQPPDWPHNFVSLFLPMMLEK